VFGQPPDSIMPSRSFRSVAFETRTDADNKPENHE